MYRAIAKLFFILSVIPAAVSASSLDLIVFENPDIFVAPVEVDYSVGSSEFNVGLIPGLAPPPGPNQVRDPDGNPLAAENLEILIDVRIADDMGMPVALSGGTGLSISGTIYEDNTTTSDPLFMGSLLEGSLIDVAVDGPIIELAWELTGGEAISFYESDAPGTFGVTRVNAAGYFDPSAGFSEDFSSGDIFTSTTDTLAAAVPLPAGLLLLISAIIPFGAARRLSSRRRAA